MRILVFTTHRHHGGGIERYLEGVLAGLRARGHDVALLAHTVGDSRRSPIRLPADSPSWTMESDGARAFQAALSFAPDVAFVHSLEAEDAVAQLHEALPTTYFVHEYGGACISGYKTWQSVPRPCSRPLGLACLAHYYPHRCGGLDPVVAIRSYRAQRRRRVLLGMFDSVVAGSDALLVEMSRQEVDLQRQHLVPYFVPAVEASVGGMASWQAPTEGSADVGAAPIANLLFVGRLEHLKGGELLIDALPGVAARLRRPTHLEVAGDGRELDAWRARAEWASQQSGGTVTVRFHGWTDSEQLGRLWAGASLLVVPSIWPEPFGMVGPEAGIHGVPAVAFDVGGISAWLADGINGHLVPVANQLRASALEDAIVRSLADGNHWMELRRGAARLAARFRLAPHLAGLEVAFAAAIANRRLAASG